VEIIFETNGKAFIGWVKELPGSFIRGRTIIEAKETLETEIISYKKWLDLPLKNDIMTNYVVCNTNAIVEEADTEILLDYDLDNYVNIEYLLFDCKNILLSAEKLNELFINCKHKNIIDKIWVGKCFLGDLPSTIEEHFDHVLSTQKWYLNNIGGNIGFDKDFICGRKRISEIIMAKYRNEGNKIYEQSSEIWTIRKVIRRLIWHDRFHAKAIEEMEERINRENQKK
jgi:hypothetical protein